VRLVPTNYDYSYVDILGSESFETILLIVRRMGNYAAATIRDLSYQTEPMRDAQRRGRESVINLELEASSSAGHQRPGNQLRHFVELRARRAYFLIYFLSGP
jgi:hypothetical protein